MDADRERDDRYKKILSCILDIGETLLTSGAEVMRVEDTMTRICTAYGFVRTDVFTITSSIVITVVSKENGVYTQTRRIHSRNIDLDKVAEANALSRRLCANPLPPEELKESIAKLADGPVYSFRTQLLTYGVISAVFSIFFGGTVSDSVGGFISGFVLYLSLHVGGKLKMNSIVLNTLCSGVAAVAVTIMWRFCGIGNNPDKMIIGNIMLLIPGLALTTSLRDMINGDTISGLLGFCEAIIKALAIAIGSALILSRFGG